MRYFEIRTFIVVTVFTARQYVTRRIVHRLHLTGLRGSSIISGYDLVLAEDLTLAGHVGRVRPGARRHEINRRGKKPIVLVQVDLVCIGKTKKHVSYHARTRNRFRSS